MGSGAAGPMRGSKMAVAWPQPRRQPGPLLFGRQIVRKNYRFAIFVVFAHPSYSIECTVFIPWPRILLSRKYFRAHLLL